MTKDDLLKNVDLNNFELLSELLDNIHYQDKVSFACKRCGRKITKVATNIANKGLYCPNCDSSRKKTPEQVRQQILDYTNNELVLVGEYLGTNTATEFRCNTCQRVKRFKPNQILTENRRCNHKDNPLAGKVRERRLMTKDKQQEELDKKFGKNVYEIVDKRINIIKNDSVLLRHSCGTVFKNSLTNILTGKNSCPECSKMSKQSSTEDMKFHILNTIVNSEKIKSGEYKLVELIDNDSYTRKSNIIKLQHTVCGNISITNMDTFLNNDKGHCKNCNLKSSKFEIEFEDFLNFNFPTLSYIKNYMYDITKKYTCDFYFPTLNKAIDLHGEYWHSETVGKHKTFHLNKLLSSESSNIHMVNIYQQRNWVDNSEVTLNFIRNFLSTSKYKFNGRDCYVKFIDVDVAKDFLNQNHLYGYIPAKYKIGLFHKKSDILLSVITIGENRFSSKNNSNELYRYAVLNGTTVLGGFNKLISYAKKNSDILDKGLITYADRNIANTHSNIYNASRLFKYIGSTEPSYFYFKSRKVYSRQHFQKHKLSLILPKFDPLLTEAENMVNNGYVKVWNCGNLKYQLL